jgi:hypothetical protein
VDSSARDDVGVTTVELFAKGSPAGTDTASSFVFSWDPTMVGFCPGSSLPGTDTTGPRGLTWDTLEASDGSGIAWIELRIDGKLVESSSRSTLSYRWNTRKAPSGSHTISAVATDRAGNENSVEIGLTVPASEKKRR